MSVAPDATVYVRLDSKDEMRIDRSDASRARVQKHGRPISAREFAALRRKPTGVTAARRSAASNGVKGWRGEPWLNQKLRPSLHPRAKHAPVFVQHGGRKSPREYAHCIAGQGIGLLAMPQCLQQPGLAVPLLEGGARSIHGHREWAVRAHRGRENRRNAARYGADRSAISTVHGSSERSEGETQTEGGGMIPTDEQRQKARNALDDVEDALQSMRDLREALAPTEARIDLDVDRQRGEERRHAAPSNTRPRCPSAAVGIPVDSREPTFGAVFVSCLQRSKAH